MKALKPLRFEQVPLAVAQKVAREQARLRKIKIAKAIVKQGGGKK